MRASLRLTEVQRLILRAALLPGEAAQAAWQSEARLLNFERAGSDPASFGLLPLVYLNLAQGGSDFQHAERLKDIYRHAWHRSTVTLGAAPAAVHTLHQAGLPFVILNAAAALRQEGEQPAQPLASLEVWMPASQVPLAEAQLGAIGWRLTDGRGSATLGLQTKDGARLNLVTRPFPGPNKPAASALQLASVPVTLGGVLTSGISAHDYIVYAGYRAVYGLVERRLDRLAGIAHALHSQSLSTVRLGARAREMGVVLAARRALATLAEHAPSPTIQRASTALAGSKPTLRERLREATYLHPAIRKLLLRARQLGQPHARR